MMRPALQIFILVLMTTSFVYSEEYAGPRQLKVPDMGVVVDLPSGWSLRYDEKAKVRHFFLSALAGSVRTLRFSETRREESSNIDVAMAEYQRVQGVYSGRRDVRFQLDKRDHTKTGYYVHYTVIHPQLGISRGFIGVHSRGPTKYLVATGEGIQARVGKRQGLVPTPQDMYEMQAIWSRVRP